MEITEYIINQINDPTGIIAGERYEYRLYIDLDEEDDLYSEGGTGLRVIFAVDGDEGRIASYHFFERTNEKILDFELEDDEKAIVLEFCRTHRE
ncbi:DUF6509 family protein [Sporosarcina sp. JAI121]|uniref:DUF6509 family protein n=1 Tax=Sporosarcina sp. JAI121 TaxID=2723064 RepID=UPI0015CEE9BE|nr:DUF6509 family protein [Sporosarcina sp. JAI121]NYF25127.1 hypothetical protein [Sporosarcina sp. JAI121]